MDDMVGPFRQMFREVYTTVQEMIDASITRHFGTILRGGKILPGGIQSGTAGGTQSLQSVGGVVQWANAAATGIAVSDGTTTISAATLLKFLSGAVVSSSTAGEADVSIIGGGGSGGTVLLDYVPTTDMSAVSFGGGAWNDWFTQQSFTTTKANAVCLLFLGGAAQQFPGTTSNAVNRILVDGAQVGPTVGGGFTQSMNLLEGCPPVVVTVATAGAHTIKAQCQPGAAATIYCRQHTLPQFENFSLVVLQL